MDERFHRIPVACDLVSALNRAGHGSSVADGIRSLAQDMATHGSRRDDPVRRLMTHLGDRWSVLILLVLAQDGFRYATLQKVINALVPADEKKISKRMLTLRLRDMETEGMIRRDVSGTKIVQVDYSLTPLGQRFVRQTRSFIDWIVAEKDSILSAEAFGAAIRPPD